MTTRSAAVLIAHRRETLGWAVTTSSLGLLLVAVDVSGIVAVLLGDREAALRAELQSRWPHAELVADRGRARRVATAVAAQLAVRGAAVRRAASCSGEPLALRGTPFQRRVWACLQAVPRGQTVSYQQLAAALGLPRGARAVAAACAANPCAVLVPCHRVVRSDGGLSGYRWGAPRKRALLELEAAGRHG